MKNLSSFNISVRKNVVRGGFTENGMQKPASRRWKIARAVCVSLLLIGIAIVPGVSPFAQKKEGSVKVTGVNTHKTSEGAVVTVSADAPLTRTQTWQDAEGFHLTLPGAAAGQLQGLPRGVTVRNLGKSLEVVVAVKSGAGVTVDPRFNQLNLIVTGGVDTSQGQGQVESAPKRVSAPASSEASVDYAAPVRAPRERRLPSDGALDDPVLRQQDWATRSASVPLAQAQGQLTPAAAGTAAPVASAPAANGAPVAAPQQLVPVTEGITPANAPATPVTVASADAENGGLFSYVFSTTGVLVLLLLGGIALIGVRRYRKTQGFEEEGSDKLVVQKIEAIELVEQAPAVVAEERPARERRKLFRRRTDKALINAGNSSNPEADGRSDVEALEKRSLAPVQPALFGAYRVDQEVGKLVLGQAHRLDVLSSRAPDDRRALETSLVKAMNSSESGDDGRRRAREALEEYGFIARQCASLLLANNAYDRASAARSLGEIASQASLPFLLEALYDTEGIVRAEAVASLGALKMPSAIGALIDMARRHPEMPASLVSGALNACSIECFDFLDTPVTDRLLLETGDEVSYPGEITRLDPAHSVEALPEWFDDDELSQALEGLREEDAGMRASAARKLSQFQVQPAVQALTAISADDPDSSVRAAAVTSLGEIEHESVFGPIIMAFADEAREVRAAAARSLSRMNFERAEAYVRLIETANAETLGKVARACIKAGMVAQAIDRLISEDRRLAYEAFSLLSLLAKSEETEPLVDAISSHPELNVRLALVRLLGTSGGAEVATLLRHLAVRDGLPEKVRSALLEVVYKLDQTQPVLQ
ncbi:MAG: hypothetical protein QOJ64_1347 [Acidobacteriota bacterium]|jgi:HEAT repeat protein|nr:hypothetical protein [Acidobacteriota bacterium]